MESRVRKSLQFLFIFRVHLSFVCFHENQQHWNSKGTTSCFGEIVSKNVLHPIIHFDRMSHWIVVNFRQTLKSSRDRFFSQIIPTSDNNNLNKTVLAPIAAGNSNNKLALSELFVMIDSRVWNEGFLIPPWVFCSLECMRQMSVWFHSLHLRCYRCFAVRGRRPPPLNSTHNMVPEN